MENNINNTNIEEHRTKLYKNLKNSYSPYSKYAVSAILVTIEGKEYTGVNIENNGIQSYCAERVAFLKAVSEGEKNFSYICIMARKEDGNIDENVMPCGYCREFISEFTNEDFKIYIFTNEEIKSYKLKDIYPKAFNLS